MDTLDELDISAKVGRVVNLVLKEDAGHLVADKLGWLHGVVALVEVVVLEGAGDDGELEVASRREHTVARSVTPHLEGVGVHHVFGA